jgi:hypothetical protein
MLLVRRGDWGNWFDRQLGRQATGTTGSSGETEGIGATEATRAFGVTGLSEATGSTDGTRAKEATRVVMDVWGDRDNRGNRGDWGN